MASRRLDCKYRSNGAPPRPCRFGPRVRDAYTSAPTYTDFLQQDEWGILTDPRLGNGLDTNEQAPGNDRGEG